MFPEVFFKVFCGPSEKLNADTVFSLFTVVFSDNQNLSRKETVVVTFWRHFLLECEGVCVCVNLSYNQTAKEQHSALSSKMLPVAEFSNPDPRWPLSCMF